MTTMRPRLGRGLESLIPLPSDSESGGIRMVALDQITASPEQLRRRFEAEPLRELADSIRVHGLLQPVLLRRRPDGFELLAGERRWRAARMAGLQRIPAMVREDPTQAERLVLGLIENLQREDLDPIEEAQGIRRLIEHFGLTHEEAAGRLGKHRVAVSQALRLLHGAPSLQSAVAMGAISSGHARALIGLDSHQAQEHGLKVTIGRRLSVRQTEAWVKSFRTRPPQRRRSAPMSELAQELSEHLGLSVQVAGNGRQGRVSITYTSVDELTVILGRLRSAGTPSEPRPKGIAGSI